MRERTSLQPDLKLHIHFIKVPSNGIPALPMVKVTFLVEQISGDLLQWTVRNNL